MSRSTIGLLAIAALLPACLPQGAEARGRHHHMTPAYDNSYASPLHGPYAYDGPGAAIFAATERAQHEPGVTQELAPDSRQTATGGPSGGIPGFSGF